jgi:hypothetical protein
VVKVGDTRSLSHSKLHASEMDIYYIKHLSYRKLKFICFGFVEKPVDTVGSMKELSDFKTSLNSTCFNVGRLFYLSKVIEIKVH